MLNLLLFTLTLNSRFQVVCSQPPQVFVLRTLYFIVTWLILQFLEAANSRRLVADYNLSDLSTQVSDLDVDIGVEINKVHHCSTHGSTAVAAGSVSCEGGGGVEGANGSHNGTKKAAPIAATDRAWWNELLTSLHDDVHFQASLQSCIDQGESAYRK